LGDGFAVEIGWERDRAGGDEEDGVDLGMPDVALDLAADGVGAAVDLDFDDEAGGEVEKIGAVGGGEAEFSLEAMAVAGEKLGDLKLELGFVVENEAVGLGEVLDLSHEGDGARSALVPCLDEQRKGFARSLLLRPAFRVFAVDGYTLAVLTDYRLRTAKWARRQLAGEGLF